MKLKVAVIDSGVNQKDSLLKDKEIESLYYTGGKFQSCLISSNMHGTEVVKVLLHEAPDIGLLSVRVLQEDNRCMISAVLKALRYCIDKQVQVINLSLGSCGAGSRRLEEMKKLCDEAEEKGIAVFAANHNIPGKVSYPANFNNVIGINTSEQPDHYCSVSYKDKMVEFSENMVFIPDDSHCVIRKGNSYLCPFIVGLFCQYANGRTIQTELMDGFMRFLDRFAKKNIHKIFFNKSEIQELQELDGKRILYFADEWDYNNQHIFQIYEKRSVISWCFREIYKKDVRQMEEIFSNSDIFFVGALSNEFMYDNAQYLHRLIEFVAKKGIEILMVFPVLNTFDRMHLADELGSNIKSIYK